MKNLTVLITSFLIGSGSISLLSSGSEMVELPIRNSDLILKVRKTHAHPFLAEYDLLLILNDGSKEIDSTPMTGDTGGLSRIDVLKLANGTYVFRDHAITVCLNVKERKFDRLCDSPTSE